MSEKIKHGNRKVIGTDARPRASVFRSNKSISVQLIDDGSGKTLAVASAPEVKKGNATVAVAKEVGKILAEKAKSKKITKVVFDRNGYRYHGQVKSLAEGIRQGGLEF
jgi:large subunit ribosomal protein L18